MHLNNSLLVLKFEIWNEQGDVSIACHHLLRKRQQHHCQPRLLRMSIEHVAQSLDSSPMWAAVYSILRKLKLISNWLQKLCLLHAQIAYVAVE